jgi:glycosyltransferase involved in cell wall biosynthesis
VNALAVVVIAQNEAPNIVACLSSVISWAREVYVVDSFSTDDTVCLARAPGATVVQNTFVDWAAQRNWALDQLPLTAEWVLFLDADELATSAFRSDTDEALAAQPQLAAFYVTFDLIFLGRALRHAYESPPVIRLIRRGRARWQGAGAREYCQVDGGLGHIGSPLRHEDCKGLSAWIEKQNRNATREACLLWSQRAGPAPAALKSSERQFRVWARERVWRKLPLFVRPLVYFGYRYIVRGGFLDGSAGLAYTFLQGFWYNFLIDAKYFELAIASRQPVKQTP